MPISHRADLLKRFYEVPEGVNFALNLQRMHNGQYEWIVYKGVKLLFDADKVPQKVMDRVHQYIIEQFAKVGFQYTSNSGWILSSTPATTNIEDRMEHLLTSFKGFQSTFRNGSIRGATYNLKEFYEYARYK